MTAHRRSQAVGALCKRRIPLFRSTAPWTLLAAPVLSLHGTARGRPTASHDRAAATFPAGRLMLLPGIGLLWLYAMVVEGVIDRTRTWLSGPARWAALYVAGWAGESRRIEGQTPPF